MKPASIFSRFLATLIDYCILSLPFIPGVLIIFLTTKTEPMFIIPIILLILVFAFFYFPYFESSEKRATPGKQILNIQVCTEDFKQLSFGKAILRQIVAHIFIKGISLFAFVPMFFTDMKQTAYDMITKTVVVKSEYQEEAE